MYDWLILLLHIVHIDCKYSLCQIHVHKHRSEVKLKLLEVLNLAMVKITFEAYSLCIIDFVAMSFWKASLFRFKCPSVSWLHCWLRSYRINIYTLPSTKSDMIMLNVSFTAFLFESQSCKLDWIKNVAIDDLNSPKTEVLLDFLF